jgi:hypothetical protein
MVSGAESLELELELLKKLCEWLVVVWDAVAFGNDVRPPAILEAGVSAAKAFGEAPVDDPEMKEWWNRHAVKAADPGLPDLFFERQADELVVSWDSHVYVLQAVSLFRLCAYWSSRTAELTWSEGY